MYIKTTKIYHHTAIRMAEIKNQKIFTRMFVDPEISCTADWNVNETTTLENSSIVL